MLISVLPFVDGYGYKITGMLTAAQMDGFIVVRLYDGDGNEHDIYNNSKTAAYFNGYTYGPEDYFLAVKKSDGEPELKALCAAMNTYGKYAAEYFDTDTESDDTSADITDVTAETLSEYKTLTTGTAPENAAYYGSSLLLKSRTSFRFYFTGALTDFTVKDSDGKAIAYNSGTAKNMFYIEIPDIPANDLDKKYTVSAGDYTITAGALTYAYNSLNTYADNPQKTRLCNLVRSLYKYNLTAKAYFDKEN